MKQWYAQYVSLYSYGIVWEGTSMQVGQGRSYNTMKPVYNDHLMEYFSAFWSSSRCPSGKTNDELPSVVTPPLIKRETHFMSHSLDSWSMS